MNAVLWKEGEIYQMPIDLTYQIEDISDGS